MSKTKGSRRKRKAARKNKKHFIIVPLETTPMYCDGRNRWVVDEAIVECVPGRVFALGSATTDSKLMTHVAGWVFQPGETIPAKPPAGAICGRITGKGTTYEFSQGDEPPGSGNLVDRRVQGATVNPQNVLVTWARFKGSPKWVRSLREREFVGVNPPP